MHVLIQSIIYVIAYLITICVGSPLVEYVLQRIGFTEEQKKTFMKSGIIGAGKIIGMLERTLTLTFIFMNQPTAIAIIFAAKSIIRFETAKERPYAEYYLIGTLTSITFATLIGVIARYLTSL